MAFTVVLRRRAQADIIRHREWLEATHGLRRADRWRVGLLTKIIPALETDPHRYPQAHEAADLGVDLREMLHGRRPHVYRVLFTIDEQTVNIQYIRHASQDLLATGDI